MQRLFSVILTMITFGVVLVAQGWMTKQGMLVPHAYSGADVIEGRLYVVSGSSLGGNTTATERYDPASNSWTNLASIPVARVQLTATELGGKLYAVGGYTTAVEALVDSYDPVANAWTSRHNLAIARFGHAALSVNGRLYVFGGRNSQFLPTTSVESYDPLTNSWTAKASMPTARAFHGAAVFNGKIYVVGGTDSTALGTSDIYDPATDMWSSGPAFPGATSFRTPARVISNVLYVLTPIALYAYDGGSWDTLPGPVGGLDGMATGVIDGLLYAAGGAAFGFPLNYLEAYTPSAQKRRLRQITSQ